MMSISTQVDIRRLLQQSRCRRGRFRRAPPSGYDAPARLVSAKILRTSSSTTSTFLPASVASFRRATVQCLPLALQRDRLRRDAAKSTVSSSSRSGDSAYRDDALARQRARISVSKSALGMLAADQHIGGAAGAAWFWISSTSSRARMSRRWRSITMPSRYLLRRVTASASPPRTPRP